MSESFSEISRFQKKIVGRAIMVFLGAALVLLLAGYRVPAKGLVLGAVFSVINFLLMGIWGPLLLGKTQARARMTGLASILTRYAVLAIPLIVAVKSPSFSFLTTAIGLFAVPIVTLADQLLIQPLTGGKPQA